MTKLTLEVKNIGEVSDGYHTFDELYSHRCLLFLNLCIQWRDLCAWRPDDSTLGWFLLYLNGPTGQISYHLPEKYLGLVISSGIVKNEGMKWDGHTSDDVVQRLKRLARLQGTLTGAQPTQEKVKHGKRKTKK